MRFVDRYKTVIEQILEAVSHMIDENGGYLSSDPGAIEIDINNVSDYFEGVRVHPLASDWYADLIKKICGHYKVEFLGKSDLYRPTV